MHEQYEDVHSLHERVSLVCQLIALGLSVTYSCPLSVRLHALSLVFGENYNLLTPVQVQT